MEPESRRSLSTGRLSCLVVAARESCEQATRGTFRSMAIALSEREIVSLERTERPAMMRADRELREFGEENDEEKEESVSRRHRNRGKKDDVVLDESFLILSDLVRMTDGAELPVKIWL